MRRFWALLLVASAIAASPVKMIAQAATATAPPAGAKPTGRIIDIEATDQMKFSVTTISAKPGEALRVRLKVVGTLPKVAMAHNFVLFKADTTQKQLSDFVQAGAQKGAVTFIPPEMKDLVLASTVMAGGGQTVEVSFNAPKAPGSYTYLCSFNPHFLVGMKGTLVVK